MSWLKTILFMSLEMKDKLGTGRKLLSVLKSSEVFFRRGLTKAALKESGTVPDRRVVDDFKDRRKKFR